ncbi:MAG: hypothetical protein EOO24_14565 [Comamonadaceae bacterium]|nr:MAG: hypothetical protein EOO24_14565 [Comamonadaceae bacterium]
MARLTACSALRPAAFSIDAITGVVTLTANPDYETKAGYAFTVVATDAAGLSAEQAVSLAIEDLTDETPPSVSVLVTTTSGSVGGVLNAGDTFIVSLGMSETVTVDTTNGTPRLALAVGGSTVYASYDGLSNGNTLQFTYTVAAGDNGASIFLPASPVALSGASITDTAGNAAKLNIGSEGFLSSHKVDTTAPTLTAFVAGDGDTAMAVDGNIVLTFSETVRAGSGNIVISNGDDVRTIAIGDPQVTIDGNEVTVNPTADLQAGQTYSVQVAAGALLDGAGNAHAGVADGELDFTTEAPPAMNVVFDLVEGVNSNHSGRTFQEDVSYTIYVRVNSYWVGLNTDGEGPGEADSWGTWTGGANLGADDRIVLVGSGGAIEGRFGSVDHLDAPNGNYIAWETAATVHASGENVFLYRYTAHSTSFSSSWSNTDTRLLWTGHWSANPNQGEALANVYLHTMPAGILTSQGLAGGGIPA